MNYRADIDGLRAVAVLAVVFFHYANIDLFSGYIGVDIFFVISGFLITGIIKGELDEDRFSLARFYERRIRRIMPALSLVLIASTGIAYILFLPAEMMAYAKSLIGAALFGSNFVFWAESGYFDMEADLKPLLHTWSLAIEEQFYIFFPLIMMAAYRFLRRHMIAIVWVLCAASFLCNIVLIETDRSETSFYMITSRAWELMIGALIALYGASRDPGSRVRIFLPWMGVVFIIGAFIGKVGSEDFPGFYALLPTLGAAMIVYAGQYDQHHAVSRFLSLRPVVGIGKISYSLYLWHWPLYVFAAYYGLGNITPAGKTVLVVLCFILAYLSWRFVEQPARHRLNIRRLYLFGGTLLMMLTATITGLYFIHAKGMTHFHDKRIIALTDVSIGGTYASVEMPDAHGLYTVEKIGNSKSATGPSVALWGDSHSTAISPAVHRTLMDKGKSGILIRNNTCFVMHADQEAYRDDDCVSRTDAVMEYLLANKNIKTVILANRWAVHFDQMQKKYGKDGKDSRPDPEKMRDWRTRSLVHLIETLSQSGKKVILLGPVPELQAGSENIPSLMARIYQQNFSIDLRPAPFQFQAHEKDMMPVYRAVQEQTKASIIWPHNALCDRDHCRIEQDGRMLYYDDDHLSTYGAGTLAPLFRNLL